MGGELPDDTPPAGKLSLGWAGSCIYISIRMGPPKNICFEVGLTLSLERGYPNPILCFYTSFLQMVPDDDNRISFYTGHHLLLISHLLRLFGISAAEVVTMI